MYAIYSDSTPIAKYLDTVPVPFPLAMKFVLFVELWTFRSQDHSLRERKFQVWNFRTLELSLPGTFAPWNFCTLELSLPGTHYHHHHHILFAKNDNN